MKTNEAPEKLYIDTGDRLSSSILYGFTEKRKDNDIEYTRTNAFIEKAVNYLNNNLDDAVEIRVPGTIIPHRVLKRDFIDEFAKHMKGE